MRGIIITLVFFFGPVILMFAMRHLALLLHIWLRWKRIKRDGPDVIDITPGKPHPPSLRFKMIAVILGLVCAALVWMRLADTSGPDGTYIPAHIDKQGHIISGQYRKP